MPCCLFRLLTAFFVTADPWVRKIMAAKIAQIIRRFTLRLIRAVLFHYWILYRSPVALPSRG
jgi:hypothetical protein